VTWEDHYAAWRELLQANRRAEAHQRLQEARKRVAQNTPDDWKWLKSSLSQPQYKSFVASVFRFQPVPKRLFAAMLRAAVLERDPSLNRQYIEPCVRSFGAQRVLEHLVQYLESGTDAEKAGAASAFYWTVLTWTEPRSSFCSADQK
jgi:hypothetical protein